MQGSITPPDSNSSPPPKSDFAFSSLRPDPRLKASPRQVVLALLALILILAAVLRFHQLTRFSFWIDEGVSVAIARLDARNFLRILWRREANMSLYYVLLRGWLFIGPGAGEFFVRSLSAIFGIFSVASIYALGARIRSRMTGLVAALLLAVNAYHIRYSQEARGYSLAVFLALLSCYFFLRLLHEPSSKHSRGYILASSLAVYSHFYVALVLLAQWLSLRVLNSETVHKKEAFRCARWILILLAPVAIFILSTGVGPIAWLSRPGIHELYVLGLFFAGGDGNGLALLYLACVSLALVIPRERAGSQPRWNLMFLVLWLVVPIALVFILSLVKPVFLYRYLIVSLPALCLLAAWGITRIKPRWLGGILLAAVAALSLIADTGLYARGLDQPLEDWRSATAYILSQSQSGDAIIFYTAQGRMPYEFYAESSTAAKPAIAFPAHDPRRLSYLDFMGKPLPATIASLTRQRVWLVLSHNDPNTEAIQRMLTARYAVGSVKEFSGISVLLYQPTVAGERSKQF
jgi:4-amino-4-deoxy-L-arabinose transferase-like glycosyltransferase